MAATKTKATITNAGTTTKTKKAQKPVEKVVEVPVEKTKIKEKVPTMKKWGYITWRTTIVLTMITIFCCIRGYGDTSTLGIICGLAWAETGVYTGCYAYKSKAENKLKITQGFIAETADKYGIEAVTPIIQSIIQE